MATIRDLSGKYYGTIINFADSEFSDSSIKIWCPNSYKPSSRELAKGWTPERGYDHIEDEESLKIATIVCEALTKNGY